MFVSPNKPIQSCGNQVVGCTDLRPFQPAERNFVLRVVGRVDPGGSQLVAVNTVQ